MEGSQRAAGAKNFSFFEMLFSNELTAYEWVQKMSVFVISNEYFVITERFVSEVFVQLF